MGQNTLDAFVPLEGKKILAPCSLLFDFFNDVPTGTISDYTWAGVTLPALVIQLSPRSVKSPYVFDLLRSVEFCLQFENGTHQPGDLSIWIPDTNFLYRIHPNVLNTVTNAIAPEGSPNVSLVSNTYGWPMMAGRINVNAKVDSTLYLIKEFDFDPLNPHPMQGAWCNGTFNLQNWEVSPILAGGG